MSSKSPLAASEVTHTHTQCAGVTGIRCVTFERAAAAELGPVADRSDGNAAGAALILLLQVLRRHHLKHTHLLMKYT